jgi:DNA-binding response OmpR family regulator
MAYILLIEPDAILAETYKAALEYSGHEVRKCAFAQAAITLADDHCPDIVILELQLVGHNGLEFLYEFRSYIDWRNVPVIVLSGMPPSTFAGSWEVLTAGLGVAAYLHKPRTSLKKLLRTVDELLPAGKSA